MAIKKYLNKPFYILSVPNKIRIKLGNSDYLVVDLTEPLREDVEVYPGDPKPKKQVFSDIRKTGFQHHVYCLSDHCFHPHGDAPSHQNKELRHKGFESYGIEFCFNPACLIDLSNSKAAKNSNGIKYLLEIRKEHLVPYSQIMAKKGAVVIRTGYDRWIESNRPHKPKNIPYLSKSAAEFIAGFKNIKVVGTDSITFDPCEKKPVHFAHQALKGNLIVESMVHLYEIPAKARSSFYLQTSPVRIVGATGGPIAAYAFIEV